MEGPATVSRAAGGAAPEPVVEIGALPFANLDGSQLLERVFTSLAAGHGGWIVTANLDFLQRAVGDPEMAALYRRADLIVADGAPIVWASHLQGTPLPERVAGSELVWHLAERAAREDRSLYLLGGEGDAAARAAERLVARWPRLRIAGCSNPWVAQRPSEGEIEPIRRDLERAAPDLVYVGLGSPKQEFVIAAIREALPAAWLMGCGISLSFLAGDVTRAPAWMQRTGLEWLHRMGQEPGRLAGRYLRSNLPFALQLLWGSWRTSPGAST